MSEEGYALILEEDAPFDVEKAARIIAQVKGAVPLEVALALKGRYGILDEDLTAAQAHTARAALEEHGMRSFIVRTAELVPLADPVWAWKARPLEDRLSVDGFWTRERREPVHVELGWRAVGLIVAARVQREEIVTRTSVGIEVSTGMAGRGGTEVRLVPKTEKVATSAWSYLLDLLCPNPPVHLRFDASSFAFGSLGMPLRPSSFENFCMLVQMVIARAPSARVDEGARLVLDGDPLTNLRVASLPSYDNFLRWKLQLMARPA